MKTRIIYISLIASLIAAQGVNAKSAHPTGHQAYAKVTSAEAVYRTIEQRTPVEQCWTERTQLRSANQRQTSKAPTIIGSVIGAVIGNELGHGRDQKQISTLVGSVIGASIANKAHNKTHSTASYGNIERCETSYQVEQKQVLTGYTVHYHYNGRNYSTFSTTHPGKRIAVEVNVKPRHS